MVSKSRILYGQSQHGIYSDTKLCEVGKKERLVIPLDK
jgi:hypothetical protein